MTDVLTGTERILNTPLPIAYTITITQISWAYILLLPFQIFHKFGNWTPVITLLAAYIILGFSAIGTEIENPFGMEVNDLPLESFCDQIEYDIDVIMSKEPPKASAFIQRVENMPLYPVFMSGYGDWAERDEREIREGLKLKMTARNADLTAGGHLDESGTAV
jgi:ion channel-forming bestrophin family protein